jgi:hypothetical protein
MDEKAIRVGISAALVTLGIAACGGSSGNSSSSSSTAAAPSTASATSAAVAATTSASSTSASAPDSAGGVAAPGTKLAIGKTAIVGYRDPSDFSDKPATQRLQVTVTSIAKGSLADFKGVQLDAAQKASTPFYVKVRITNVGPGNVTAKDSDPSVQIQGIDSTGQAQQSVTFIGDFPRCDSVTAPTPMTRGKAFQTCLTFLIPGGIKAAAYTGTSQYESSPVTWK